ncbi:MAG: TerC family protein [Bacteroidales bacterium]|nr:TerC family protein [Bacteroidales bacterium]
MEVSIWFWIGFHVLIASVLAIDLLVVGKESHKVPLKEALTWTAIWVGLAILFNLFIYFKWGGEPALEFLTGYVIEYSLSIDNIFVFILLFATFGIPAEYQHKVLFWGIIGALVMRGIFVFAGVALINRFHWIVMVFGLFLVFSGIKMLFSKKKDSSDPNSNVVVRIAKKSFRVTDEINDNSFFVKKDGQNYMTPLFLTLLVIESSDLIFAVDSIPAILAVSHDRFIVYTSNIMAILGLRSLYFSVSGIMDYFRYLKVGLAFVLAFVGAKMLLSFFGIEIPILLSLMVIIGIIVLSILASLVIKEHNN